MDLKAVRQLSGVLPAFSSSTATIGARLRTSALAFALKAKNSPDTLASSFNTFTNNL